MKRMAATRCTVPSGLPGLILRCDAAPESTPRRRLPRRSRRRPSDLAAGAGPPARSRRWSSRAGSSWSCSRSRWSACGRSRAPPGRSCCCSSSPALIALLLNPFVTLLRRARFPRGAAVADRDTSCCCSPSPASACCSPTRSPTRCRRSATTCPRSSTTPTTTLADLQDWLDDNGIDVQVAKQGQTALDTLGDRIVGGVGRARHLHARRAADARRGLARADPDHRAQRLHAALRRADRRRACARSCRAGRRLAGGRLPDARPGARCSATSAASCCSR